MDSYTRLALIWPSYNNEQSGILIRCLESVKPKNRQKTPWWPFRWTTYDHEAIAVYMRPYTVSRICITIL